MNPFIKNMYGIFETAEQNNVDIGVGLSMWCHNHGITTGGANTHEWQSFIKKYYSAICKVWVENRSGFSAYVLDLYNNKFKKEENK